MADTPPVFQSALLIQGKPIGQLAYEAFTACRAHEPYWSGTWARWEELTPHRQQTWDNMADAFLETYEALCRQLDD